jgi:Protein of unknown function (DUF2800)
MIDERKGLPSASSWRRYELCTGSYQLEKEAQRLGQAVERPTRWSADGSLGHAALAGEKVELPESLATTVGFLNERSHEQLERIFQGTEYLTLREKRLWLYIDDKPALSGQFDLCAYTPKVALVQDVKFGWDEPDPAEQNSQLKVLAVLVAMHIPVNEVIVQLISGPYGVTEARYGLAELSVAYNEIVATWRAINAPDAPFSPSPEACKHCKAITICQAVKDQIAPVAKLQLSELPVEPERAGRLLDEIAVLRNHFEKIEEFYYERLAGDPTAEIKGYALVPGTLVRSVTDWDTARERLSEFIPPEALKGAANYRLGDLEKALGKTLKLKAPQAKERMNQILEGLVVEKQNSPSLKRVGKKQLLTSQ